MKKAIKSAGLHK